MSTDDEGTGSTGLGASDGLELGDSAEVEIIEAEPIEILDKPDEHYRKGDPVPIRRERTRGVLALVLLGSFVLTIVFLFVGIFVASSDGHWDRMVTLAQILVPAQTTLIGSAIGFYFGTKHDRRPGE